MSPKSVRVGNSVGGTTTTASTTSTSTTSTTTTASSAAAAVTTTTTASSSTTTAAVATTATATTTTATTTQVHHSGSDEMEESGLSGNDTEVGDSSGVESNEDEDEDEEEEEEEDGDEENSSEDSSDMDVQECEKKRYEYIDDLTDLEKQFAILREQLYRERMTQIEAKLEEVKSGKAHEYLQPLEELEINLQNRLEVGTILRELRLENIHCKFEAEKLANEQNFESEKDLLWDSIKADLEEKIHLLEEDKNNVDFTSGLWEASGKSRRRKADPTDPDRRKKPVSVTGPYIIYMLHENDILDDWTVIKKAISQRKTKTDCINRMN